MPIKLFYSYASKDERFARQLDTQLSLIRRMGLIEPWSFRTILPGDDWRSEIDRNLNAAQIILLLISSDFMASDYCYDVEMRRAMTRHRAGDAVVIPIILRETDWKITKFAKLQALPKDGKPVNRWRDRDAAWQSVVQGIRRVAHDLIAAGRIQRPPPKTRMTRTFAAKHRLPIKFPQVDFPRGEWLDSSRYAVAFKVYVQHKKVTALISGEALQDHFGATPGAGLVTAFRRHRREIHCKVDELICAGRLTGSRELLMTSSDFGSPPFRSLVGKWETYSRATASAEYAERDTIILEQRANEIVGRSSRMKNRQYVLEGSLDADNLFSGVWYLAANPKQRGTFQLVIAPDGREMSGRWLGMWLGQIQDGEWNWRRK